MDAQNMFIILNAWGLVVEYGMFGKGFKYLVWTVGWMWCNLLKGTKSNRYRNMTNVWYVKFVIYMKNPGGDNSAVNHIFMRVCMSDSGKRPELWL